MESVPYKTTVYGLLLNKPGARDFSKATAKENRIVLTNNGGE